MYFAFLSLHLNHPFLFLIMQQHLAAKYEIQLSTKKCLLVTSSGEITISAKKCHFEGKSR